MVDRSKSAPDRIVANTRTAPEADRGSYPFGAPAAHIYQPAPSPMQSGRGKRRWRLEFEPASPRWIEPLMGWTASEDPFATIQPSFPTLAAAVDYAERMGLAYRVHEPPARRPVAVRYRNPEPSPQRRPLRQGA
ncbi:MAG: ETC complex I subunit [Hyphomicrobiaceae bacterium]|nr:ETC complex I subunit [Hyphomicrobiaceae bacterium]